MRAFKFYLPFLLGVCFLLIISCKKDNPNPSNPTQTSTLKKISGDNQIGFGNQPLNEPLIVRLSDVNGIPESNKFVYFLIVTGDGIVSGNKVITDQNGMAQVTWTPGPTVPVQTVKAYFLDADNQPVSSAEVEFTVKLKVFTIAGGNGNSSAANQLNKPSGVFVDNTGNIFVADTYNHRIQKIAFGTTSGTTIAGGNGQGFAANQLHNPSGIFVDAAGNVFVADKSNNRIQKFAPGLSNGITIAGGKGQGIASNQLSNPSGVFVDAYGNLFVTDQTNNRIQKFALGATTGVTVAGGNGQGAAANQLHNPSGIFVDAAGNIFVSDTFNHRIMKFASGATSGVVVAGGNGQGALTNMLQYPMGISVNASENIFVADNVNDRVQNWLP